MIRLSQEIGRYRVLLKSIGNHTESEKESFCHHLSENYPIPIPLVKKIVDRCPIILKKNLPFKKAEILARTLKSFGATVSIEERRNVPPIFLEFQELVPHQLALESSYLRKTKRGLWGILGRVENISDETLNETWVLLQLFDDFEELIIFEETPLPINPLPSGEISPFKIVFEGSHLIKKISIAFKNASGHPIPAVDKRKKREWVEVKTESEEEHSFPPVQPLPGLEEKDRTLDLIEASEPALSQEQDVESSPEEEIIEEQGGDGNPTAEESISMTLEPSEEILDDSLSFLEEHAPPGEEESEGIWEGEPFEKIAPSLLEKTEEEREEDTALCELRFNAEDGKADEAPHLDASVFEEATQLLEDISEKPEEVEEEKKPSSFPWLEYFREVVETYHQKPRDLFSSWYEEKREGGEFKDSIHALLTILVHSRFDQGNPPFKALENTQKVFRLITQPGLLIDEIPPLEGNPFVSREVWRDLFHRAFPKIQQIGNAILEKNKWDAFELEKLIQVIPHMGYPNSRRAIQWIHDLIPNVMEIDLSNFPILIREGLYRVASRLGIVDPHFDSYQGSNSMGDIKIQSFARTVFPQNPTKVEEPMEWMGKEEEQGGHCFPIQPWCEGCLFETFCLKLCIHFNPSEKGMRGL